MNLQGVSRGSDILWKYHLANADINALAIQRVAPCKGPADSVCAFCATSF